MSSPQVLRAEMVIEHAHPRRIARNAEEWARCAQLLEEAATRIDSVAARHHEIGGQTGPSMLLAMARASDALRTKARDLRRGGDALATIADATLAHREERRRIDRDHPDDGQHVAWREEGSRRVADSQEQSLRQGVAVMKSIQVGDDPGRTPVQVVGPGPTTPPTVTWWPPTQVRDEPPLDPDVDPDEGFDPETGTWGDEPTTPADSPTGACGVPTAALAGAGVLGAAGLAAGARGLAARAAAGGGVLGAGGSRASGGVLGGRTPGGPAPAAGGGATGGQATGARTAGAGGAGGRGAGGRGAAGTGAAGGRGGRRTDDEREGDDRDLHDDGTGWLDDDSAPGVLR